MFSTLKSWLRDLVTQGGFRRGSKRRGVLATGAEGVQLEASEPVHVSFNYGLNTLITTPFYVAPRPMRVVAITGRVLVKGSDGGGTTIVLNKAPSATALSGGTALHTSSINIGTTATNDSNFAAVALSVTAAACSLAKGDCVGLVLTGVSTAAVGVITLELIPLA